MVHIVNCKLLSMPHPFNTTAAIIKKDSVPYSFKHIEFLTFKRFDFSDKFPMSIITALILLS